MLMHFIWCEVFIHKMRWGLAGAALATNLTYFSNMIITDNHSCFSTTRAPFLNKHQLLSHWLEYLHLGIPSALMICFEWWAFELLALFAGLMGVNELVTEVVLINIVSFLFMMPLGISFAAAALTGNYIGQHNIPMAKRLASMALLLSTMLTLLIITMLVLFNNQLSRVFTHDPEIV